MDAFLFVKTLHIRLTLHELKLPIQSILGFLEDTNPLLYLVTMEDEKIHPHYHILLQSQLKDDKSNSVMRKRLNKLGLKGNKHMSISTVRSQKQLIKYILKDNQPIWKKGISDLIIEELRKLSYSKGSTKFAEELTVLEDEFLLNKILYKTFVLRYLQLKARYNHSVPVSTTRSYFNKMQLRKNPVRFSEWMYNEYFLQN